jgi:hypothetical protein
MQVRFSDMQRLLYFAVVALAGCPAPGRYVVADVTASRRPVEGALVAASCGDRYANAATRTDDGGRARMRVPSTSSYCSLTVAKPGLPTVETGPVNVCPTTGACTPTRVDLRTAFARPFDAPTPTETTMEYAPAPRRPLPTKVAE